MESRITRVAQGNNSTLSHLYLNGIFQCYLLEDKIQEIKIPKQTAIPTGEFKLRVNTWGGKNVDYKRILGDMHKGMIEINGLPNFDNVYFHIGNTITDTAGCPLCGFGFLRANGDYLVTHSKDAYQMIYPKLLTLAINVENKIIIENNFQF